MTLATCTCTGLNPSIYTDLCEVHSTLTEAQRSDLRLRLTEGSGTALSRAMAGVKIMTSTVPNRAWKVGDRVVTKMNRPGVIRQIIEGTEWPKPYAWVLIDGDDEAVDGTLDIQLCDLRPSQAAPNAGADHGCIECAEKATIYRCIRCHDKAQREMVRACAEWLRSEHDPDADGWEADALRAADELTHLVGTLDAIRSAAPRPRQDPHSLEDYMNAPSGVGPLAPEWKDKPHRLVYDLVRRLRAADSSGVSAIDVAARALCDQRSMPGASMPSDYARRWAALYDALAAADGSSASGNEQKGKAT